MSEMTWRVSSHSGAEGNCAEVAAPWRTSSHSNSQGQCAEVSLTSTVIQVRDTKDRERGQVAVSPAVWETFLDSLVDTV
jgi:hypothetical protein